MIVSQITEIRARIRDYEAYADRTHHPDDREQAWLAYASFIDHAADDMKYLLAIIEGMSRYYEQYDV